ncbi:hypothetical protein D1872_121460 [compost metagenome]
MVYIFSEINYFYLFLASLIYFISYFLRAIRVKFLLQNQDIGIFKLLGINLIHNFYNRILPARLGDFSLIFLLNKFTKKSVNSSVNAFIFIKLYDFSISLFLFTVSYTLIYKINGISIGAWITTILAFVVSFKPSAMLILLLKFMDKFDKYYLINKLNKNIVLLIGNSEEVERGNKRVWLLFASLGIWILITLIFYFLLFSINKNFGLGNTFFATNLANFSWILPINGIGGFGTMEVSMAYAYSLRGYLFQDVLIYALYTNIVVFILSTLFAVIPGIKLLKRVNRE